MRRISNVIGFDDFPFERSHRGDVPIVGVAFAGNCMHGVVTTTVRRDGANAARRIAEVIRASKFNAQLQLVFLQGIALAGFNVVDVFALHRMVSLPIVVVARRQPDYRAIELALRTKVRGGGKKYAIIERLGPMERCGSVFVQRVGIEADEAHAVVQRFAINSVVPEPLRVAHLIAGGIALGVSGYRV